MLAAATTHHPRPALLGRRGPPATRRYEEFHPYGTTAVWAASATIEVSSKRYRYTGMERDEESGMQYHSARYYAPAFGRWTACDPLGPQGGLCQYGYASGNPLSRTDRNGLADVVVQTGELARGTHIDTAVAYESAEFDELFVDQEGTATRPLSTAQTLGQDYAIATLSDGKVISVSGLKTTPRWSEESVIAMLSDLKYTARTERGREKSAQILDVLLTGQYSTGSGSENTLVDVDFASAQMDSIKTYPDGTQTFGMIKGRTALSGASDTALRLGLAGVVADSYNITVDKRLTTREAILNLAHELHHIDDIHRKYVRGLRADRSAIEMDGRIEADMYRRELGWGVASGALRRNSDGSYNRDDIGRTAVLRSYEADVNSDDSTLYFKKVFPPRAW